MQLVAVGQLLPLEDLWMACKLGQTRRPQEQKLVYTATYVQIGPSHMCHCTVECAYEILHHGNMILGCNTGPVVTACTAYDTTHPSSCWWATGMMAACLLPQCWPVLTRCLTLQLLLTKYIRNLSCQLPA